MRRKNKKKSLSQEWLTYLKFYKREKLLLELEDLRLVVGQVMASSTSPLPLSLSLSLSGPFLSLSTFFFTFLSHCPAIVKRVLLVLASESYQ